VDHPRNLPRLAILIAFAGASYSVLAQGPDELWEVTMSMEMEGMSMPAQTQRMCKPKAKQTDEDLVPRQDNCKVTDSKKIGNKTTFTMVCEGKDKMTATGEMVYEQDGYRGTMHAKGMMDGEPMDMTQKFAGRRVGSCTYEDPSKQYNAMVAEQCKKAMDEMNWAMFTMDTSPCKDRKAEFCGKASKILDGMREPAGYRAVISKRNDWTQMAQACGQDPAAVTAQACKRSVGVKDWEFVMQYCEAEGKALAQQNCEGRTYTAAMASEYAPLCRKYTSFGGRSYTASVSRQTQEPTSPSAADKIKDGANKLKKFLKF
jgi:hypothetical protein